MKANGSINFQQDKINIGNTIANPVPVDVQSDKDSPVTIESNALLNIDFLQTNISITTLEVEAKVGVTRLDCRKSVRIYNGSDRDIFWGPSGVSSTTGEPLRKRQSVTIAAGPYLAVFIVSGMGTANDIIIMEFS